MGLGMANQVCFTGFSDLEKEQLSQQATANGLDVVKSVTRSLAYLVAGPNAGPKKLRTAIEQNVVIMDEGQFARFLLDGTLPTTTTFAASQESVKTFSSISADGEGILDLPVADTPTAIIDFETTGLSPGLDRVVEVSVIRREPDGRSEIAFDTLVNPHRPMGATEIHGITDADVANAPTFGEIAVDLAQAISGCVFAAYNVYFDMRFFTYEMARAGIALDPPHVCLMYLRPLLGLGGRCSLGDACQLHGIPYSGSHMAGDDAEAAARLMDFYFGVMQSERIRSFRDLSCRGSYKFLQSFNRCLFRHDSESLPRVPKSLCSRKIRSQQSGIPGAAAAPTAVQPSGNGIAVYWDSVKTAVADLRIDEEEMVRLRGIVEEYGLRKEQVRMVHARAFACVIDQFICDQSLDDREAKKLKRLYECLSMLGWAPGE
jgi:DNA polymerase-3 subunit epsilon